MVPTFFHHVDPLMGLIASFKLLEHGVGSGPVRGEQENRRGLAVPLDGAVAMRHTFLHQMMALQV